MIEQTVVKASTQPGVNPGRFNNLPESPIPPLEKVEEISENKNKKYCESETCKTSCKLSDILQIRRYPCTSCGGIYCNSCLSAQQKCQKCHQNDHLNQTDVTGGTAKEGEGSEKKSGEEGYVLGKALNHPVLFSEPANPNVQSTNDMFKLLFERFGAPAVCCISSQELTCYSYGRTTALVVDIGHSCTTIQPLQDGVPIRSACRVLPSLGTHALETHLRKLLQGFPQYTHMSPLQQLAVARDIRERLSFCCLHDQQYQRALGDPSLTHRYMLPTPVAEKRSTAINEVPLYQTFSQDTNNTAQQGYVNQTKGFVDHSRESKATHIELTAHYLMSVGEYIFRPQLIRMDDDDDLTGLADAIESVIRACPVSLRGELWSNVLLTGGGSMLMGLSQRLKGELKQ